MCDIKFNNSFSATSTLRRISYYLIIWSSTLPFNGKDLYFKAILLPNQQSDNQVVFSS